MFRQNFIKRGINMQFDMFSFQYAWVLLVWNVVIRAPTDILDCNVRKNVNALSVTAEREDALTTNLRVNIFRIYSHLFCFVLFFINKDFIFFIDTITRGVPNIKDLFMQ